MEKVICYTALDGESLKDTADRVLPYFETEIMVIISSSILIAIHGNSLEH